ncbi:MAG: hypothetical protein ABIH00_09865 [Armatimonadota bacterium]
MKDDGKKYLKDMDKIFNRFGEIQKRFNAGRDGIKAIVSFIGEMSRKKTPAFALDDPILVRGSELMKEVIDSLDEQLKAAKKVSAPTEFSKFHKDLLESLKLQVSGYKEMTDMFADYKVTHALKGKDKVTKGVELIEKAVI